MKDSCGHELSYIHVCYNYELDQFVNKDLLKKIKKKFKLYKLKVKIVKSYTISFSN